jgi:hypothetical protein
VYNEKNKNIDCFDDWRNIKELVPINVFYIQYLHTLDYEGQDMYALKQDAPNHKS